MFSPETRALRVLGVALVTISAYWTGDYISNFLRKFRGASDERLARRIHYAAVDFWMHLVLVANGYWLVSQNSYVLEALAPSRIWTRSLLPPEVAYYYTAQLCVYCGGLVLALLDRATPDRARMLAHHVVTLFLVGYSLAHGMWPVGLALMLACDPSDVLLHAGKLAKDAFENEVVATLFFVGFIALWAYQRLYGIVALIIAPYVASHFWGAAAATEPWYVAETSLGVALALAALAALFAAWTYEIGRSVWRKLRYGELEDVREAAAKAHGE